jgi:ribonuclease D
MRDETLSDVASHPRKKQADLAQVRGLSNGWREYDIGKRMMKVIADSEPLSAEEMPVKNKRGAPLGKEGALVADLLKLLLKIRCREIDIASRLLTKSDELEALAAGLRDLPILKGWRFDVFGKDALEVVEGKTGFAVKDGKLVMSSAEDMRADMIEAADEDEAEVAEAEISEEEVPEAAPEAE